jgi:flagellar motor protein MotB
LPAARPELRAAGTSDALAGLDDDQSGWLVTFSDLVLQLFAFVLVSLVLGKTPLVAAPVVASAPLLAPATAVAALADARTASRAPRRPAAKDEPAAAKREARPPASPPSDVSPRVESVPSERAPVAGVPGEPAPAGAAPVIAGEPQDTALVPLPPVEDDALRLKAAGRYLAAFVDATGMADAATVTVTDAEVVLSLADTIGFASGSAELLPAALPVLAEVRTLAGSMPDFGIDVAGHTDDVPIHTTEFPSNLELSLARAARVAHEVAAGDPQVAMRTVAAGFGEHRPIASNEDPEGRARNRRVELRLVPITHSTP